MSISYTAHCGNGVFLYDRKVTVTSKLRDHKSSQCGIIRQNNTTFFVSYETIVCEITDDFLHCYGTFSQTTRKQIGWFLEQMRKDYCYRVDLATYQTAKRCYEKGIEVNLYNGDERKASDGIIQTIGTRVI